MSTGGADTNNCSLAAPCRGFAKAITVTDPGGELVVLDSGGYGSVTVNKNVTIVSPSGVYAGISVFAAQDGVTVAGPATKVVLRGLTINGQGGNNGIRVQAGEVHVESTVISNMTAAGILVEGGSTVRVSGSVSRSNLDGLRIAPAAGAVSVVVRDSEFSANATAGIGVSPGAAGSSALVTIERSSITRNGAGIVASPGGSTTSNVVVTQSVASENTGAGISSSGSTSSVFVRESAITRNGTGLLQTASGILNACGANLLVANATPQSGAIATANCLDVASATGTVTSVATGAGLTGGPITTTGTINLTGTQLLPAVACGTSQVPQWNGSAWTCATIAGGGGTVTNVGTGTGLTGGPITTSGTVAADTTYLQRRVTGSCTVGNYVRAIAADGTVTCGADASGPANAFVQGGNAFGATATLGTIDGNPFEIYVNGDRTMRYEPNAASPSVIGGSSVNSLDYGSMFNYGAVVAGGGAAGSQVTIAQGGVATPIDCTSPPGFGCANEVSDAFATIGGGAGNQAGRHTGSGGTSWAFATVGGGLGNVANARAATIAGGMYNTVGPYGAVSGGYANKASGYASTVGGGLASTASSEGGTVAGGGGNTAGGTSFSTVGGGQSNIAQGDYGTVAGGSYNYANGNSSTSSGGFSNIAGADFATVPGGSHNQALGASSFAAGAYAVVNHDNSFLWCDGHTTCNSQEAQDFIVVAQGGIKMYALTGGCILSGAATQWFCTSDRNVKENFVRPDPLDVLRRVAALPVTRWNEKGVPGIDHMGPVAQDFYAAFGLGADDLHIGSTDISGVALVAIQGLNAKLETQVADKEARIEALERHVAELESMRGELVSLKAAVAEMRESRALLAAH